MAGEAAALKDFLVSFGYVEDTASAKAAVDAHAAVEKKVTANQASEEAKRSKLGDKSVASPLLSPHRLNIPLSRPLR